MVVTVTVAPLVVALAAVWAFFCWRVRVENGWVGITDRRRAILRFIGELVTLQATFRDALVPAFNAAARAMRRWNDAYAAAAR